MKYTKKCSDFWGLTNSEVVIFGGYKKINMNLCCPPSPPITKICEWGHWGIQKNDNLSVIPS